MASSGDFKSFKDLLRASGGKPADDEAAKKPERGWTIEREDGSELDPDSEQALLESGPVEGARERIARRPVSLGPMAHGPAAYRDPESEELELLASFRVRTVFPVDVLTEADQLPSDPVPADFEGRLDLRDKTIFTIDGADAKDFDDAIHIEAPEGGRVLVGVHIADVAHYVTPGTALDAEALARATSCYLPDQVVPMLPEKLSNELCSLVAHRPRLAFSVLMTFDAKGDRLGTEVRKTVIRSVRRNTYKEVQELLDGTGTPPADLKALEPDLRRFERWAKQSASRRESKGAMRLPSREQKFEFDAQGEVARIVDAPRYFSMSLIEETALAANQAVGDLFRSRGLPTIYRVHPEKDPEEIAAVAAQLAQHGIRVPEKDRLTGRDISRLIRAARRKPNADALIQRIMGLVERAVYEVRDHEDVATHFGLAKEAYLHFTSPIRRYPDLIVHRWLWAIESRATEAESELLADAIVADLNDVAAHSSIQAEAAEMASRAIADLKVCQFVEPHVGETLDARVVRVSPYGLDVHLTDLNVNAFLPVRAVGQKAEVKGATITIRAGRRNFSFSEGHPIRVKVKDVDFIKLSVNLELP